MHLLKQHMVLFFLLTKTVVVKSQHPLMTVRWPVWNGLGGLSPVPYMSTKKNHPLPAFLSHLALRFAGSQGGFEVNLICPPF